MSSCDWVGHSLLELAWILTWHTKDQHLITTLSSCLWLVSYHHVQHGRSSTLSSWSEATSGLDIEVGDVMRHTRWGRITRQVAGAPSDVVYPVQLLGVVCHCYAWLKGLMWLLAICSCLKLVETWQYNNTFAVEPNCDA